MTDSPRPPAPFILASASPSRAGILRRLGIAFDVDVSDVDEPALVTAAISERDPQNPLTCAEEAMLLARAKAEAVAEQYRIRPDAGLAPGADDAGNLGSVTAGQEAMVAPFILGCDSVFELDGASYGKPLDPEVCVQRWQAMRGRTGVLHTGHWMIRGGEALGEIVSTSVTFAEPTDAQIRAYVATGEPLHCAGGFTIDGHGAAFVRGVDGDHLAVIGLSAYTAARLLRELGGDITQWWTTPSSGPN